MGKKTGCEIDLEADRGRQVVQQVELAGVAARIGRDGVPQLGAVGPERPHPSGGVDVGGRSGARIDAGVGAGVQPERAPVLAAELQERQRDAFQSPYCFNRVRSEH